MGVARTGKKVDATTTLKTINQPYEEANPILGRPPHSLNPNRLMSPKIS